MQAHPTPPGYAEMTDAQKVAHWSSHLYRGMRWAGEDGADEISVLDEREHMKLLAADADIDRLMPQVLAQLARAWLVPVDAFILRVNRQMGKNYQGR